MAARTIRVVMVEGQAIFDAGAGEEILAVLHRGGLVVYPTDTVYGIGADPTNADSLARLYAAKSRPEGQPISVVVASLDAAKGLAAIPPKAEPLVRTWLPGPVTLVFRATAATPPAIISAQGTVAVRVPNHPVALFLAKQFGPLTATSANAHGKPPAVVCEDAQAQLGESVDLYVDAGPCPIGRASTVVDFTGAEPRVIREGAVAPERLGLVRRRR